MPGLPPSVVRLVRAIVRLYPRVLRDGYGDDILAMLDDMWRAERPAGRIAALAWLARQVWRVCVAGLAAHADRWRGRASRGAAASNVRVGPRRARGPFVGLGHDLRLTARVIARQPGFSALTIATLALGIGATTTIYALAYHVWLKPLPYANASRLVMIEDVNTRTGSGARFSDPETPTIVPYRRSRTSRTRGTAPTFSATAVNPRRRSSTRCRQISSRCWGRSPRSAGPSRLETCATPTRSRS